MADRKTDTKIERKIDANTQRYKDRKNGKIRNIRNCRGRGGESN